MKKTIIIFFLLLFGINSFSQSDTEINKLVDRLSWSSITSDHSYVGDQLTYTDSNVISLLNIGSPAVKNLYESIDEAEKTVIIHIILTNILEPENKTDFLPQKYVHKDCDDLIGWHYFFNGLVWEWYSGSDLSITAKEISKIKKYWSSRIYDNVESWNPDVYKTFAKIDSLDATIYPCDRIYNNNSDSLEISELTQLLGAKYPSDKFDRIFEILGDDSNVLRYPDCFYISYDADGIDFRFDSTGFLTTVFFEKPCNLKLISGLKITDTKEDVITKLGNPNKERKDWIWYDKYNMGIDFYSDQTIKTLQINSQ